MAIKPQECTTLEEKERLKLIQLEKYIDQKLKEKYIAGYTVEVYIDQPSNRVFQEILKMYKKAGWTIEHSICTGRYNDPTSVRMIFKA